MAGPALLPTLLPTGPAGSALTPYPTTTTFQVMTYNPLTDGHQLVLDLNDGVNFRLHVKSLKLAQPKKATARSSTMRAPGERITRWQYQNRTIAVSLFLRDQTPNDPNGTTKLLTNLRNLLAAIEQPPYELRIALPKATLYSYADVVHVTHNIPSDTQEILAGAIRHVEINFECLPGLRGDRVMLQNLVQNPGFEAPSGPAVTVFSDLFASTNQYTLVAGSTPTLAANVMTIANSTTVSFGSPVWGAVNLWQVRFKWVTSLFANFDVHYVDGNNKLQVQVGGTSMGIFHYVGGTSHTVATSAPTLTNGNFYWLQITQFPTTAGTAPYVQATLYNDSGGALGSAVTNGFVSGTTFDAVTAMNGKMAFEASGAALAVGGNFGGVHLVSLFGPGGWTFNGNSGSGNASGAWDGTVAGTGPSTNVNTFPNGPVTSFGAGRIDFPPAGTVTAAWDSWTGGAPVGSTAIPVNAGGDVVQARAWTKTSGLSGAGSVSLQISEWNSSGTFLRQTILQTVTTNQPTWTQLSGMVVTGANCAYVAVVLLAADAIAGASANATIWFDNVQCWDQTMTGPAGMPYCELTFPQAPGQVMVSGLQGDMPSPALLEAGTYDSGSFGSLLLYAGRLAKTIATLQAVQSIYPNNGPNGTPVLDNGSYGGWYSKDTSTGTDGFVGPKGVLANQLGTYHILARMQTAQTAGNLSKMSASIGINAFAPAVPANLGPGYSPNAISAPFAASAQWNVLDLNQIPMPWMVQGALQDFTQIDFTTFLNVVNGTGTPQCLAGYWCWMPVDGETFIGQFFTGASYSAVYQWIFVDGLRALTDTAAWSVSLQPAMGAPGSPIPNPAAAIGGSGNASTGGFNSYSDPYLTLDPTSATGLAGVNQVVVNLFDPAPSGGVLPLYTQFMYIPRYLYPR